MDLFLLRHGRAEEAGFVADAERALTPEGIQRMTAAAQGIQTLITGSVRIFTSPLLRARQTAEIVAAAVTPGVAPEICATLAAGMTLDDLAQFLNTEGPTQLLAVGHQPDLSIVASGFISATRPAIEMERGSLCHISFASRVGAGRGVLRGLLTEDQLMLLGS